MQRMKKMFSTMMLFAAAAMAFVSCQKNEIAPEYEQTTLTFTSSNPETKTEWNGETIVWSSEDRIRMALKIGDSWYSSGKNNYPKFYVSTRTALSDDSQTAKFVISGSFATELTGEYQFYALYPSDCTGSSTDLTDAPKATYTIKSEQSASSQTFDNSADIMWGRAVNTYTSLPETEISLMWTRLVAHANITLDGLCAGEKVNRVTLTAQEDAALVGKYDVDITTGVVSSNTPQNTVTINCSDVTVGETGAASFWACINPCTITSLDIVVDTDAATYTISKTGFEREFLQNKRNTLPVDMTGAEREEKNTANAKYYVKVTEAPEDWSGTYLLVCEDMNNIYAGANGNYGAIESVTIVNNQIVYTDAISAHNIVINSVEGGYVLSYNNKYIENPSSTSLKLVDSVSKTATWTLAMDGANVKIVNVGNEGRRIYRSGTQGGCFAAYTSKDSDRKYVQLYKLQD